MNIYGPSHAAYRHQVRASHSAYTGHVHIRIMGDHSVGTDISPDDALRLAKDLLAAADQAVELAPEITD